VNFFELLSFSGGGQSSGTSAASRRENSAGSFKSAAASSTVVERSSSRGVLSTMDSMVAMGNAVSAVASSGPPNRGNSRASEFYCVSRIACCRSVGVILLQTISAFCFRAVLSGSLRRARAK
jgi:hypothetical protein